ncbi:plant UBX domain-containing protein 7 isoform X2 [Andrographis paniculata]|uniref:plant UBX domain-containing protein 7 isoform X2 n=1 Tax=Andrographis paniculata TaxID=175694 RepID=UPI0021E7C055|nr:plant UBX domain-containing protein 7 isoform X2 [Andrographis paniculata]
MEGVSSPADQQNMVSSFLEIAVGQTADTARRFLQATGWKLEEAIQLFYVGNEGGFAPPSAPSPPWESEQPLNDAIPSELGKELVDKDVRKDNSEDVRPPLPVKREVLYDNPILHGGAPAVGSSSFPPTHSVVPFRNFGEEMSSRVWEAADRSSAAVADKTQNNLASLYRPPFELMFQGSFEKAKDNAKMQNKWLLINLQSNKEFSSHMLNRDTWANEAVAQTIKTNFIFWQVYDDSEEGSKVCTYYKLYSIPVILVIDPITGQKMHSRSGMVQPEALLEDLLPFMDGSPSDHHVSFSHKRPRESSQAPIPDVHSVPDESNEDEDLQRALAASMESFDGTDNNDVKEANDAIDEEKAKKPAYLPLPEEPKSGDRSLLCRVGVRLPDGRRVQRNFLRTDPVQLLWSFCYSELKEDARPFGLTQAIPGASRTLDYNAKSTIEESGLANAMVSVTWE